MKDRKEPGRTVWVGAAIIAVLGIAVLGGGWFLGQQPTEAASATLDTGDAVKAFVGDLASSASATGRLRPKQEAHVALRQHVAVLQHSVEGPTGATPS